MSASKRGSGRGGGIKEEPSSPRSGGTPPGADDEVELARTRTQGGDFDEEDSANDGSEEELETESDTEKLAGLETAPEDLRADAAAAAEAARPKPAPR